MSIAQIILAALGIHETKPAPDDDVDVVHERAITSLSPSEYDGTEFPPEAVRNVWDQPRRTPTK